LRPRTRLPHFFGIVLITVTLGILYLPSITSARLPVGLGLVPNRTPIVLGPGETGTYPVTIHNGQGRSVTLTFLAIVVSSPPESTGTDLALSFPNTVVVGPGNTHVTVMVEASGGAAPGNYLIQNSITPTG